MKLPKISIVVPIYNCESFLRDCLLSLINQTYKNIEVICINDGSTDGSGSIVEEFTKADSRIVYINQKNQGVASARNAGLRAATGDYVMWCDGDDYFYWETVETCVKICITHNHYDAVFYNARMFDDRFGWEGPAIAVEPYLNMPAEMDGDTSNFLGCFGCLWLGMFSLSLIREHNLSFRDGFIYEDWDFIVHFNSIAKKIYWLNRYLYNYRWLQSTSISGDTFMNILEIFIAWEYVIKHFKETNRWENNQYSFYEKAIQHILQVIRDRLNNADKKVKEAFIKKSREFVQSIPYTMLCSLICYLPIEDRITVLKFHSDYDAEVKICEKVLKKQKISKFRFQVKEHIKKILVKFLPTYRAAHNTRLEMEQLYGQAMSQIMNKMNEISWLLYENRKDINSILYKMGIDDEEKYIDDIKASIKNENHIK